MSYIIHKGDTGPSLTRTLVDASGDPLDLTDATVELAMLGAVEDTRAATVNDPEAGTVTFDWIESDTEAAGVITATWKITADGVTTTYPHAEVIEVVEQPTYIVTANDLIALLGDDVEDERAYSAIAYAQQSVSGYIGRPLTATEPDSVKRAVVIIASRICTSGTGGEIIQETIGSYSYQRAQTGHAGDASLITDDIKELLGPWRASMYSVDTPSPDTVSYGDLPQWDVKW